MLGETCPQQEMMDEVSGTWREEGGDSALWRTWEEVLTQVLA